MASGIGFLLLLSAACVFGAIVIDDLEVQKSWKQFKKDFNKVYANSEDEAYRRTVFERALEEVFVFNMAHQRGEESYYIGINQFSDMTDEERLEHREITCSLTSHEDTSLNATEDIKELLFQLGAPPKTADWSSYVSLDVRDQRIGQCGGCYAFAAVSAVESQWAIKNKKTGKAVPNLSEQEIIDCGTKYGCSGCAGGHPCSAYDTIKGEGGLADEKSYPWRKTQKPPKACMFKGTMSPLVKVTSYKEHNSVTNMDYNLQVLVGLRGPATASVCANSAFEKYAGGVFNDQTCFTKCKTAKNHGMNHSIIAIGYTDDYFVIRNSWGAKWGEKGNMRIKRVKGDKAYGICGLGIDQSLPIVA